MLGIGFGRPADRHVLGGRDKNPFLNVMTIDSDGRNAERIRRGYIVTRRGVHISLTAANTQGDFSYVKLAPAPDGRGWASTPACIAINDAKPAACGSLLMDTGVTAMYLTVPESQAPAELRTFNNVGPTLVAGTKLTISIPAEDSLQALYTFTVGDDLNPLAPRRLNLVDRAPRRSSTPACASSTASTISTMPMAASWACVGPAGSRSPLAESSRRQIDGATITPSWVSTGSPRS